MKISTKGRYGLQAMLDLALHYHKEPIPLKQVAKRQGLSEAYLEQIFAILRKQGIVKSIKGPLGGYVIQRAYEEITVLEILTTLEGELFDYDQTQKPTLVDAVLNQVVWDYLKDRLEHISEEITLAYLVKQVQLKEGEHPEMYFI